MFHPVTCAFRSARRSANLRPMPLSTTPPRLFRFLRCLLLAGLAFAAARAAIPGVTIPPSGDGKLRIIAFGAHPDDCEIQAGGTAALWAQQGHHVLFVSVTNGDIGHWREAGGPLAQRRAAEVAAAHKVLGIQGVVLDNHDGELEPTLENRRTITRLIRWWNADLVLSPRPNDYHPDHRYTGILVQDAAFMVIVPFFCPDVPHLTKNPVFMYYTDRFQKPQPSKPDVVIGIDSVLDRKLDALGVMISQFAEGGAIGHPGLYDLPRDRNVNDPEVVRRLADPAWLQRRQQQVRQNFSNRFKSTRARFAAETAAWYPGGASDRVQHAEAFEVCEYGTQPSPAELRRLFPFHR